MQEKIKDRKIVVVNQASNYLTVGFCNAFSKRFEEVSLITGGIHEQGEVLSDNIKIKKINKWYSRPVYKKIGSNLIACIRIYFLLLYKYRKHEVFFVSVPQMAYLMNIVLPNRFSIVVWDVFPNAFKITGMSEKHPIYRIWAWLNKKSFQKAYRLFTIGERMADLIEQYVSRDKIVVQPIWSVFQENGKVPKDENPFVKEHGLENKFVVQYSGNIGLSHKVEVMIELAELFKNERDIEFLIIGRGTRVPHLKEMVRKKNLPNCRFLPFQSDEMFPYSLSAADIGVVILDATTAKGSVPSKSYNLMSYGIPSLYIASVDSELNHYACTYKHAKCFEENEIESARDFILKLKREPEVWNKMSKNANIAASHFKRENADKFVEKYLRNNHDC